VHQLGKVADGTPDRPEEGAAVLGPLVLGLASAVAVLQDGLAVPLPAGILDRPAPEAGRAAQAAVELAQRLLAPVEPADLLL